MKFFFRVIEKIYFYIYLKPKLAKKNIIIESNVRYRKTTFCGYNRICKNTEVSNSSFGKFSYVGWNCILNNIDVGAFCSIAPHVTVIYGIHPLNYISTHPIFYSSRKQCGTSFLANNVIDEFKHVKGTTKSIKIENDVWIGYGVKIIEGVTIKNGAVILAGSVVVKDVEAYSIVGGVPAKHIKYRIESDLRSKLLKIRWWDKDMKWIEKNLHEFLDVNNFIKKYENETNS